MSFQQPKESLSLLDYIKHMFCEHRKKELIMLDHHMLTDLTQLAMTIDKLEMLYGVTFRVVVEPRDRYYGDRFLGSGAAKLLEPLLKHFSSKRGEVSQTKDCD